MGHPLYERVLLLVDILVRLALKQRKVGYNTHLFVDFKLLNKIKRVISNLNYWRERRLRF